MYSEEIQSILDEKGIETGDIVRVNSHEGRLMPKPGTGDSEILNLKLESGYNIGIEPEEVELVEKSEKEEEQKSISHQEDRPDILVLNTGGTIASRVSYEEGGVKPAFDPEDLIEMYPEVAEMCNIHSKVVAQMLSEDMEPGHWQEIAEEIDRVKDDYDGIIVGHGTDTISFTGASLSLMLQNLDTGVLIVGAQRSSDRPSTDAAMNLKCATQFLTDTNFTGIGVCMHETSDDERCAILPPQKVRKMHTSKRDAFKPINSGKIGTVNYETGEIEYSKSKKNGEYRKKIDINPNVGFLKARPGMQPEEIKFLIEQNYDGVIIEGTGLGHLPVTSFDDKTQHHEEILERIEELSEDTVVAMTSQCINGRVNMNIYDAGVKIQNAGIIEAEDMHPELAYVKMMWSLANSESRKEAEELFQKDVNGEINRRSLYNG